MFHDDGSTDSQDDHHRHGASILGYLGLIAAVFLCTACVFSPRKPSSTSAQAEITAQSDQTRLSQSQSDAAVNGEVSEVQQRDLPGGVVRRYQRLVGPGNGLGERTEAARRLLKSGSPKAIEALTSALSSGQHAQTWRAVMQAVTTTMKDPPRELALPIFSLMTQVSPKGASDWASAMGRFKHGHWRRQLEEIAQDPRATTKQRVRSIAALGHFREIAVAEQLLGLTKPDQRPALRSAAYEALATLSGIGRFGANHQAWQQWWDNTRKLSDEDWQRSIVANFARRRAGQRVRHGHLESRLLDAQRALYRTTAPEDRSAVLAYMLGDSLLAIRKLGMDFVQQRLVDGREFGTPLRKALRQRLTDPSADIRQRAALRLRDLADQLGADKIARRLSRGAEQVNAVLEADLLMMASMPRPGAVTPAIRMLDQPQLRGEAAGALASAEAKKMLSDKQATRVGQKLLTFLNQTPEPVPDPEVVTLLSKVGTKADWNRIAGWVDSDNALVKRAAAQAWAKSDRSLKLLAQRAGDRVIQPIVVTEAIQRGDDPRTLTALAQHKPAKPQAAATWAKALVALAGRTTNAATLEAVRSLANREIDPDLRARMLTAAIEKVQGTSPKPAVWLSMILQRGENRLGEGKPALAVADFERLVGENNRLSDNQRQQRDRGLVKAYLQAGEEDQSFAAARRLLRSAGNGRIAQPSSDDPVIGLFLDAATNDANQGRMTQARSVLTGLRQLLGPRIKPEIAQRIHSVERATKRPSVNQAERE